MDCSLNSNDYRLINKAIFSRANIMGYCRYNDLRRRRTINLGEFDCKAIPLKQLNNIVQLIDMFK